MIKLGGKPMTKIKSRSENGARKPAALSANRVHVSYPDSMKAKLEEIQLETHKGSLSEVFRDALKFYALAFEEHKQGSDFLIRNRKGETERLRMFL